MPCKITWKKGMRLSADVFNAMDASYDEEIRLASRIASGERYGLFPAGKPFELSVNISNNVLEVISLCCQGITKSGKLIDIDFDSNFNATFDTRISISASDSDEAFYLVVRLHGNERREVNEMFSEPAYSFELLGENSIVDEDALPVGRIVNQYGWRLDETDFVPPCLYVGAHPRYVGLLERAKTLFRSISEMCLASRNCVARHLLCSTWNIALSEYISLDKERGAITPGRLLAAVQKTVGAFVVGCVADEYVSLENPEPFVAYIQKPYDARNIFRDIEQGLGLCADISVKMETVCKMTGEKEAPAEKPRRKPQPATEPEAAARNRWMGLEI